MKGKFPNGLAVALERAQMSQGKLAKLLDQNKQNISRYYHGERELPPELAKQIAPLLGTSPGVLIFGEELSQQIGGDNNVDGYIAAREQQMRTVYTEDEVAEANSRVPDYVGQFLSASEPKPNASGAEAVRFGRDLVPIFGQAAGGPDGRFLMNGERIDSVLRPPSLANVKDGYGVFVHGTSMLDRYEPGEIVFAAPHRPYRAGHYVVAQIRTDDSDVPSGYVKKLVSFSNRELVLEQLNPPEGEDRIIRFPGSAVVSVHKIVGTASD